MSVQKNAPPLSAFLSFLSRIPPLFVRIPSNATCGCVLIRHVQSCGWLENLGGKVWIERRDTGLAVVARRLRRSILSNVPPFARARARAHYAREGGLDVVGRH